MALRSQPQRRLRKIRNCKILLMGTPQLADEFIAKLYKPYFFLLVETHTLFKNLKLFWERLGFFAVEIVEANGHKGELRLTHGLRLREALVILFAIITHAKRGSRATVNWCLDTRWREGNRMLALSLASRLYMRWKLRDEMKPVGRDDKMNGIGTDVFEEGIENDFDGRKWFSKMRDF
ncbi:hypothetical protein PIB30_054299 [Stylosanthes scabra]|uniref:Uncharacterized protein n=1 Tax=Stylosanthes scabra TaxID=79078 RepID=A0ABU6YHK2_9FABA|nr:hypothetical protein [Stylosanthes scabra]